MKFQQTFKYGLLKDFLKMLAWTMVIGFFISTPLMAIYILKLNNS